MQGRVVRKIKIEFRVIREEIANELFDLLESEYADAEWEMDGGQDGWYFIEGSEIGTYSYFPATYWEPADYEDDLCVDPESVEYDLKKFAGKYEDDEFLEFHVTYDDDTI